MTHSSIIIKRDYYDAFMLQVAVFMTHITNYAMDRVALTLFDHLFKFVDRWTNIKLQTARPTALAKKYFETFPEDKYPLWTVSVWLWL